MFSSLKLSLAGIDDIMHARFVDESILDIED